MRLPRLLLLLLAMLPARAAMAETRVDAGDPTEGMLLLAGQEPADALTRVLPLARTDVFVQVTGFASRVRVQQVFNNPYRDPIEAVYVFPLPNQAAITDMRITVGERVIRGAVQKRAQANRAYEQARDDGKTAALLVQERPNVFTQSVANILPLDEVVVEITYDQLLHYEAGHYEFVYPMVVGPRYIPSKAEVPDAERITPPVHRPGTRAGHDVTLKVALDPGVPITGLSSESHDIEVSPERARKRTARGPITIDLARRDTIPNKDFVLRFDVAGKQPKLAVLAHRKDRDGYFALMFQPPRAPAPADIARKELVFVLDVSSSMAGEPIALVKRAMRHALSTLAEHDTFRIVTVAEATSELGNQALANTPKNVRRAISFVNGLHAGGDTAILDGIDAALDAPTDGRLRIVCFMTDGYTGNETAILETVQRKLGADTRVFPMGIGSSVNRYLLDRLAEVGRGTASYLLLDDDPAAQIDAFFRRIAAPLLTHIEVDWAGLAVEDLTPAAVPDLFADQPLWIVGRYTAAGKAKLRVSGKLAGRDVSYEVPVSLPREHEADAVLAQLWARRRVRHWMSRMYAFEDPEIVQRVTELGLDYRLMTRYTAFVALEQTVVNEGGKPRTVEVPVEMPQGVSYDAVFGAGGERDARDQTRAGDERAHLERDLQPAPDADGDMAAASGGTYAVQSEAISLTRGMSSFAARRWRVGVTAAFGSVDLGNGEGSAAGVLAGRVTRALTPRLGLGVQLALTLPTADGDRRWTSALLEAVVLPVERLAVLFGLGSAFDADGAIGLGYYAGVQVRLLQLGPIEIGVDLRLDGAEFDAADAPDVNGFSGGVTFGF